MIYQIWNVMMSIITCARVHFLIYPLNYNSLSDQTQPIIVKNLLKNLEDWDWVPGPFQFSNLLQLLNNQLC